MRLGGGSGRGAGKSPPVLLEDCVLKRFLVFAYDSYYPNGGWNDFKGSFDTLNEAQSFDVSQYDYTHIVDTQTGKTHGWC